MRQFLPQPERYWMLLLVILGCINFSFTGSITNRFSAETHHYQLHHDASTFTFKPPVLSQIDSTVVLKKDSLIEDLSILEDALTSMHPGLYRYNSKEDIHQLFNTFKDNLPNELSESKFMIRLAQMIKQIKCGHTYVNPWNMNPALRDRLFGGKIYLPLGFKVIDGRFFITETLFDQKHNIQRGAEITSLNGIPIEQIYQALVSIAKSDGNNQTPFDSYLSLQNFETRHWEAFDLYHQLFFPLKSEDFHIRYRNYGSDQIEETHLPALLKEERAKAIASKYGAERLKTEHWQLEILSEDLAVMRLGTFAIWNWKDFDHKEWFRTAFSRLDSLEIKRLAVDIRNNGGGLSAPVDELLSYLVKDTLKCDALGKVYIRTTRFKPELMPYIDTWVQALKTGLDSNLYKVAAGGLFEFAEPNECIDIVPQSFRFKGTCFLMGGASNVSATFTLLKKANDFGFATFIGETSGGNLQGINGGEYAFFTMPYSKMEIDIPLKYFAPPEPMEDAGVQPKIPIGLSQSDIANGIDPYLRYLQQQEVK